MTDNFLDHVVVCFQHCNNVVVLESYYFNITIVAFCAELINDFPACVLEHQ